MNKKIWKYILGVLVLGLTSLIISIFSFKEENLHLISCDVGQGDATLAVYKDIEILVDGGPNSSVLNCIEKHIPYWDKEIELVVISHPQADHYKGLIDVFRSYKVGTLLVSGLDSGSEGYGVLKEVVGGSDTKVEYVKDNMRIGLGLLYLDIVHPSKEFIANNSAEKESDVLGYYTSSEDPNEFSVVAVLRLNSFSALLTGDISGEILDDLAERGKIQNINYIKIPHHGSKTGISEKLLDIAKPKIAVISVGKNTYGHPNKEVLDILKEKGIKTLRTDLNGDIEIITDGERYWGN